MNNEKKYYIVDGKQLQLRKIYSAKLVSAVREHNLTHVAARLSRSTRLGIDTKISSKFLVVRGDENKIEIIKNYPDIEHTRSVFVDNSGLELILTNDVLVRFTDEMSIINMERLCTKLNCKIIEKDRNFWRIRVLDKNEDAPLDVANNLSQEKHIIYAEPDAIQKANYASPAPQNDQFFSNQWHLKNTGQAGGLRGADVNAIEAWKISYGSPDIRVVIHDSGVDINHPDLKHNILPGWDFDNDDSDPSNSSGPHGTACAGVVAASRDGKGVVGIAPMCKIVPIRAAGGHSWSTWAKTFELALGIGDIISCSWTISPNNTLSNAIKYAAKNGRNGRGILIFFATGNDYANSIGYPANLPETIAVGASTNKDLLADYSNYGIGIDFVAPSSGGTLRIETTDIQGSDGYNNKAGKEGDYCKAKDGTGFGGTSSATPLAAGVAALILSVDPHLSASKVRNIMRETAKKIDTENGNYNDIGFSKKYGYGRIDAGKALKAVKTQSEQKMVNDILFLGSNVWNKTV